MRKKDYFNIISLASIQVSNSILPLLIFPFILKKVGPELFSKLVITETTSIIILSFIIFSFEINGVSKIIGLDIKKDRSVISQIFSNVFYTRVLIFIFCTCLTTVSFAFLEKNLILMMLGWLAIPLSYIFQSLWFFQGMERNTEVAFFTTLSRICSLVLIILLVKNPQDYFLVPLIIGGSYLLGGISSFLFIIIYLNIELAKIQLSQIKNCILEGKEIFVGNMSVLLFRDLNVLLMSILSVNSVSISVYSITEKLVKVLQATTRPLNQFFFPRVISKLKGIEKPTKKALKIILKQTSPQIIVLVLLIFSLLVGFKYINDYTELLGNYPQKDRILKLFLIMIVAVFFGVLNFMTGSAGLNFLNEKKYLFKSLFVVGTMSIALCLFSVPFFQEYGAAFSFVFSEFCLLIFIVKRYNITEK